jgi:ATP-dependent protease HslVU (ClpYQ) peptidase subunit
MADETGPTSSDSENTAAAEKRLQVVKPDDGSGETVHPAASKWRTATKLATWHAWTGTIGDLRNINERFEELVQSRNDEILRSVPDDKREDLKDDLSMTPAATLETLSGETVWGDFESVIDELDPRTWSSFLLGAVRNYSTSSDQLLLKFRRKPDQDPFEDSWVVHLSVKSYDPGWAATSISRLSELVELGKPKWAWLHKGFMPALVFLISLTILAWCVVRVINIDLLDMRSFFGVPFRTAALLTGVIAVVVIVVVSKKLVYLLVPPAEIRYDQSSPSSGSRFIASLVGLLVIPLILAIVLPVVL